MQTYTHLSVGLMVSMALFPEDVVAQALITGATLVPDVPTAAWYFIDKIQGKEPFVEERKYFHRALYVSHSLIVWLLVCFLFGLLSPLLSISIMIGVYSHLMIDVISHRDNMHGLDPSWIWPLELLSPGLRLRGLFDYRTVLFPGQPFSLFTPLDIGISSLLLVFYVLLTI